MEDLLQDYTQLISVPTLIIYIFQMNHAAKSIAGRREKKICVDRQSREFKFEARAQI